MVFYAVANGRQIGIFSTWPECKKQVNGYPNPKYKKFESEEDAKQFILDKKVDEPDYYVYTDGACSKNGYKGACAGIGIYFGEGDIRNVSKKIIGKQTNNTAELGAMIELYGIIEKDIKNGKRIVVVSDSLYAIRCVTTYGKKCCKDGWKKDIPNKEMVKIGYEMYCDKDNVTFVHCKAHTKNDDVHSIGNYNADLLATQSLI